MIKKGPWTVLNTKEVYKNKWLSIDEDQVIRPEGTPGVYILFHIGRGVNVIPFDNEGNIYLAKEFYYALNKEAVGCVSGKVEEDEEPLDAAKRELKEEIGIEAFKWTDLGPLSATPQYIDSMNRQFLAEDLKFGDLTEGDNGKIDSVKISLKKAVDMALSGKIIHASSCAAIFKVDYLVKSRK